MYSEEPVLTYYSYHRYSEILDYHNVEDVSADVGGELAGNEHMNGQ